MPVSIPYRKYKKEYEIFVAVGKYVEFPSLIGSIKRKSHASSFKQFIQFPSLIGSIKSFVVKEIDIMDQRFPSLIGSIKSKEKYSIPFIKLKFPSLIGSIKSCTISHCNALPCIVSIPYRKYKKMLGEHGTRIVSRRFHPL